MAVQTTNTISRMILSTAFESGAVAWAAHAITSPIGAMGGAIFGAVRYLSKLPLSFIAIKGLNAEHPQAAAAAKTLASALVFFGSYAAAWGALAAMGLSLTVSHMVTLTIVSIFTSIGIELLMGFVGINPAAVARN